MAALAVALTFTGILVLAVTSFLMVTAVRIKQSRYERDVIQATYAAEAGIEYALASLSGGAELQRPLHGQLDDAHWQAAAEIADGTVKLCSTGTVEPKIGRSVARRIVVRARRAGHAYTVISWELIPFSPQDEDKDRRAPLPPPGRGEHSL